MVARSHTPITLQPPPDLPNIEANPVALTAHLRSLAKWAKDSLGDKLDTRTAAHGILLHANDAPVGTTPAVFLLQVKTDGTLVAVPVALASTRRMA